MRAHPFHRATGRFHSALGGLLVGALAAGVATALELNADRDAFTPSAHCVGTGRGLIEASHVYIDNLNGLPTNNFPELLIRQGTN